MKIEHQQIQIGRHDLHVVTAGDPAAPPYVFLHGWPESWCAWHDVMAAASDARCIAIDLPGIGASRGAVEGARKADIAKVVRDLVEHLGIAADATIVGHDAGGMIAYAYLRAYPARRVVIVSTVIPGVEPWDAVLANPADWHWAFHATPHLPEMLVRGRELAYFAFFYDFLSADAAKLTPDRRAQYAAAYTDADSLRAGFDLYRAMAQDARANIAGASTPCETPVLYIRGDKEPGLADQRDAQATIEAYAAGLRKAGVRRLETVVIPHTGHFIGDEQPAALWQAIQGASHPRGR
jgi:pimeloyl-ACP methyl ester carboxylesterase